MPLPNDTIEGAIGLPSSPFTVDLSSANSEYLGWAYDAFWKYTATEAGDLAVWLSYADDEFIYYNDVTIWREPFTSTEYISYDTPGNLEFIDDNYDRYGAFLNVHAGETVYISIGRGDGSGTPSGPISVRWKFSPGPGTPTGAPGGRSAILVGQQLNGLEPIDRTWRFNAIVREGANITVAAVQNFTLDIDTYNNDHSMCRIDDTRALWIYEAQAGSGSGPQVRGRIITFDGSSTITVGPESTITGENIAYIDNGIPMASDGNICYFQLRSVAGSDVQHVATKINADGTLTVTHSSVEVVTNSFDATVVGTGTGRALTFRYTYPTATPGHHSMRKVTWDTAGNLTFSSLVDIPLPPYYFDYYQSFLDYVPDVDTAFFCESWDYSIPLAGSSGTRLGVRAINPDTLEFGPVSNPITLDPDVNVTGGAYYESLEVARQYTSVGMLADGKLGVAFGRFKPDAYYTNQFLVHPIELDGLEVTVNTDSEQLLYELMRIDNEGDTFSFPEDNYLSMRLMHVHYGLVLSWLYDSIDEYHHIWAQSVSSAAGKHNVLLDLDDNTHYTWIAAGLYGEYGIPPDLDGNFRAGDRGFSRGKVGL